MPYELAGIIDVEVRKAMTSMSTTSLVLKLDGLGRVRTPVTRREELLAEFARSGLSGARFATLAGVNYQTFMSWVHKQNRRSGRTVSARPCAGGCWGKSVRTARSSTFLHRPSGSVLHRGAHDAQEVRVRNPSPVAMTLKTEGMSQKQFVPRDARIFSDRFRCEPYLQHFEMPFLPQALGLAWSR